MNYFKNSRETLIVMALFSAMVLNAAGCESMREHKEALGGTLLGGAAGGGIGAAAGGKKGAIIGGVVGALAGGMIGHYVAQQDRDRTQAVAAVGYRPEQGNLVSIEKTVATPTTTAPGQTIKLATQYTVLMPNNDKPVVREVQEVRYQGNVLSTEIKEVQREQGTHTVSFDYPIAQDAKAGVYEVVTSVTVDESSQQGTTSFTVQ